MDSNRSPNHSATKWHAPTQSVAIVVAILLFAGLSVFGCAQSTDVPTDTQTGQQTQSNRHMSCDLIDNWFGVRHRAAEQASFGFMTRCISRDRRFRWMMPSGGYVLHRGDAVSVTDDDIVVGTALRGQTEITETFNDRGLVFQFIRVFGVRAFGPQGVIDDGEALQAVTMDIAGANEVFPEPPPPVSFSVEPAANGTIVLTVNIQNALAESPATEVSIYTDGGTGGGINYAAPLGDREPVGLGYGVYRFERDPGLAHGVTLSVTVRTRSADGVESDISADSSTPQDVVIDTQGPPAMAGFTVEPVCS